MTPIHAAEAFLRELRFHKDSPRPERLAQAAWVLRVEIDAIIGSPALPEPPAGAWTHCGKQLFRDGVHAADAASVEIAAEIVRGMNEGWL